MPKGHVLTTSQRGYGWQHQVMRRRIARLVTAVGPTAAGAGDRSQSAQRGTSTTSTATAPDTKGRCNERAARGLPVLAPQRPARALAFFDI